jgi:hypothetical protein
MLLMKIRMMLGYDHDSAIKGFTKTINDLRSMNDVLLEKQTKNTATINALRGENNRITGEVSKNDTVATKLSDLLGV